jgi:hypothetical protein
VVNLILDQDRLRKLEVMRDCYKDLTEVEWAFRDSKSVYLRSENRTCVDAVVVLLAYRMVQEPRRPWGNMQAKYRPDRRATTNKLRPTKITLAILSRR